ALRLIHNLLADDGSIYIHCDYRLSGVMRLVLDEIFGENNFLNQITWKRSTPTGGKTKSKMFPRDCDVIFSYKKLEESTFNNLYVPYSQDYIDKFFTKKDPDGRKWASQTLGDYSEESIKHFESIGRIFVTKNGSKRLKYYLDEAKGVLVDDVWTDIRNVRQEAVRNIGKKTDNPEYLNYPTQKPEALLERIILASSNPGDLVADFFCGSGTTLAVAEKHARTWIGCDLSRFGIHTSRKRLINTQFELDKKNKPYNAFEILNLGHYDRQYYMGIDPGLPKEKRDSQARLKENEFFNLIHRAYKSQQLHDMAPFHGFKSETDHAVYIGSLDSPVTMSEIDEIIISAPKYGFNKVDVLGFEFEMGLTPDMQDRAKEKNVTLALRYIPRDVFDKRAIEKGQVIFYDVSYVEAKINKIDNTISVQLIDFGVFHRQEDINYISHTLKAGGSKVIVDSGQVIKITKTRTGAIDQEVLTKNWTDWIDYWSVDFDYESLQDKLSGNNIFENQWQNFRTKNNRKILTESECFKYSNPGKYKVAVKVIDIFGHDTTKVFDIDIGLTR
ncbi:site-specific DNA-methyltransferase, partial [Legionella pneumophila]